MPAGIYSAKNCKATYGGSPILGLADDNAITLTYPNDGYTFTQGIDGFITASQNPSEMIEATIRLVHTSWWNGVFMRFYNLQRANPATAFKSFSFIDTLGTQKVFSDEALIVKPADTQTSRDVPIREWKIAVFNPIQTGGGTVAPQIPIV